MFQDNPLLAQLKQQLHAQTPRVEGLVKGTDKGFGFLEVDGQKSYFIPPPQMKKVMHGDRVIATVHTNGDKESVEPEELVEPFLTRFVGRIQKKEGDNRLWIIPDHPLLKDAIPCRPAQNLTHSFVNQDWAVAVMRRHPLNKGDKGFQAEITDYITDKDDHFAPWWVTLMRHQLERDAPEMGNETLTLHDILPREDLTSLYFVTIDSASTEDMDDALFIRKEENGQLTLFIAIADPTAYILPNSELDKIAAQRALTNYLPGFNIPMLPRELSDNICSLRPNEKRPALVCQVSITEDGSLLEDIHFYSAWVESKAKLVYDHISDWLESGNSDWKPENDIVHEQVMLLKEMCEKRHEWREKHALVFKERPDYRFILDEGGNVLDIVAEKRRIANRIVEEAMITANICAAKVLAKNLGFGVYNVHTGFDPLYIDQVVQTLKDNGIETTSESLLTLEGFCQLRRELDNQPNQFLDSRIRRYQNFAEIKSEPGPHFGLGLEAYATWTSPIRKYSDILNHRLLKAIISKEHAEKPQEEDGIRIAERRRANRMAERDVGDWLYARFLKPFAGTETPFNAEIIDITRGGIRVRLVENGAVAFIPAPFLHAVRDEIQCSQETGTVIVKSESAYKLNDIIPVRIEDVKLETRNVVARPI
ncbi:exoribonuclease II [Proteus vulgaris]|uniref:exoribonuclease II n=1 Tax=Proteus vulgaris TaxID=585 RepID=UPI0021A524D1|nr:exoribonuclease II [Proteus vulgaris]UWT98751.1 exoribonuclease II [Proteus vulgaris]